MWGGRSTPRDSWPPRAAPPPHAAPTPVPLRPPVALSLARGVEWARDLQMLYPRRRGGSALEGVPHRFVERHRATACQLGSQLRRAEGPPQPVQLGGGA